MADYFIIADGSNLNQVQAMADNVEEKMAEAGYQVRQTEGYQSANWILLDYGDVIVHAFQPGGPAVLRSGADLAGRQDLCGCERAVRNE